MMIISDGVTDLESHQNCYSIIDEGKVSDWNDDRYVVHLLGAPEPLDEEPTTTYSESGQLITVELVELRYYYTSFNIHFEREDNTLKITSEQHVTDENDSPEIFVTQLTSMTLEDLESQMCEPETP